MGRTKGSGTGGGGGGGGGGKLEWIGALWLWLGMEKDGST